MKTPIEPSEIRYGDLIRWESTTSETTREFRKTDPNSRHTKPGNYFLLDRPAPPVELPTEPTLGWLTHESGIKMLGEWVHLRNTEPPAVWQGERDIRAEAATAFTPATAVPTEALNELRGALIADPTHGELLIAVATFLAAVDKANGDRS